MEIYNITGYNDLFSNITMVDGLSQDIIKRKYIWLLNATVENAIVGQDSYGLVWYSGTWYSGEWEDGTWYSGIWYDGEWKNGKWYSYRLDIMQLLQRNFRVLEKDNPIYSQFRYGIWRDGDFYNGYFGGEALNTGTTNGTSCAEGWTAVLVDLPDTKLTVPPAYYDVITYQPRWEFGTFHNGIFRNAAWLNGNFKNGNFFNSQWLSGTFLNGVFQGHSWWSGDFTGGDFIEGIWVTGRLNQINIAIKSRFGSAFNTGLTNTGTTVVWIEGLFSNGEFHSGLNIVLGQTLKSTNHNRTWWVNGIWNNGAWYGGTHMDGIFNNGYWIEGFWSGGTFNNGYWENGFWLDGIVNGGQFVHGLFNHVIYNKGQLGYNPNVKSLSEQVKSLSKIKAIAPTPLD